MMSSGLFYMHVSYLHLLHTSVKSEAVRWKNYFPDKSSSLPVIRLSASAHSVSK